MARIAGRNAALYMGIAAAGTAEPIAFLNTWSLDFTTNKIDVTAFGDANMVYVGGLTDAQGTLGGFYDTASAQLYTAAVDGLERKFYLYPDRGTATQYFHGTAIADFSINTTVAGAVEIGGSFAATSVVHKATA